MTDTLALLLLAGCGLLTGALNAVAGGGSFITLPILIFLGLPATEANATNRVGVLLQSVGSISGFHRAGAINWRWTTAVSLPALLGAALGVWGALHVSDEAFRRVLATLMVVITLVSLSRNQPREGADVVPWRSPVVQIGFFLIGLYVGFIQAGAGFLILALTSWAGLDLVRGNGIKVAIVGLLTVLTLALFVTGTTIDWPKGVALGLGNMAGAVVGTRAAVLKGHAWLNNVIIVTVITFAVALWIR